jgi:hypothetical protein
VEERPREPLLVPHHCRLQLAAAPSSGDVSGPRASVPEVIRDAAAPGEPLDPVNRRGDGEQDAAAAAAPCAGGEGGEGGGGRRRCCGEHDKRRG